MKKILVSACLVGRPVRYDGAAATLQDDILDRWVREGRAVIVCPEVSGGLSTPRDPAEIVGGTGDDVLDGTARVVTDRGVDVTAQFVHGAEVALALAQKSSAVAALLQERSPSCGSKTIYDGTFSKNKIDGRGVTASLLERHGIRVFRATDIVDADLFLKGEQ